MYDRVAQELSAHHDLRALRLDVGGVPHNLFWHQPDGKLKIDRETTDASATHTEPSATSSAHHSTISRDDQTTVYEKTRYDLSK